MSYKCADCTVTVGVKTFCVECNKTLCKRCVGRLHPPECKKACLHTLEDIDMEHKYAGNVTSTFMSILIFFGLLWAALSSRVDRDYFNGSSICPSLGQGRHWLAHLDANLFYYFKTSLATYCDVEDSFWRLIMDGWMRGIVTGTDSVLLLAATLPKAILFKSAALTFLVPVFAVFYAFFAATLNFVVVQVEDAVEGVVQVENAADAVGQGEGAAVAPSTAMSHFHYFEKMSKGRESIAKRLEVYREKFYEWKKVGVKYVSKFFLILAYTGMFRLVVRYGGLRYFPVFWQRVAPNVNTWQLAFEPITLYYLSTLIVTTEKRFDKMFPQKKVITPTPATLWRKRDMKNYDELIEYSWNRCFRTFNFYKKQGEGFVTMVVGDVFNMVVLLRVLGLVFGLTSYLRFFLKYVGLAGIISRHSQWFSQSTGFVEGSQAGMYLSDRLLTFTYSFWGFENLGGNLPDMSVDVGVFLWEALWRLFFPACVFFVAVKYMSLMKKQEDKFTKEWPGVGGGWGQQMKKYGSFWIRVEPEAWVGAPKPKPKAA